MCCVVLHCVVCDVRVVLHFVVWCVLCSVSVCVCLCAPPLGGWCLIVEAPRGCMRAPSTQARTRTRLLPKESLIRAQTLLRPCAKVPSVHPLRPGEEALLSKGDPWSAAPCKRALNTHRDARRRGSPSTSPPEGLPNSPLLRWALTPSCFSLLQPPPAELFILGEALHSQPCAEEGLLYAPGKKAPALQEGWWEAPQLAGSSSLSPPLRFPPRTSPAATSGAWRAPKPGGRVFFTRACLATCCLSLPLAAKGAGERRQHLLA